MSSPAMLSSVRILGRAIRDLGRSFAPLLGYDILFRLASSLVIAPLTAAVLRSLVLTTGRYAVGNQEIVGFLLSPAGLLVLLASGVLGLFLFYLEHAGLILIGHAADRGRRLSAASAFLATMRHLPDLIALGTRQLVIVVLAVLPFLVMVGIAYRVLWAGYDLYYLTTERPPPFWAGVGIASLAGAAGAAVALRFALRWLIALPVMLIEGTGPATAMRLSRERTRGSNRRNLAALVLGMAGIATLGAVATALFVAGGDALLDRIDAPGTLIPVAAALLATHVLLVSVFSFIGTAVSALAILEIAREARCGEGQAVAAFEDGVPLAPSRVRPVLLGGVALLLLLASLTTYALIESLDLRPEIAITAHRGDSSRAPENTLAAIREAIEAGADYAEIDVQLSADGVAVVIHDEDLRRVAGDPRRIRDLNYEDLRLVDVGAWFGPAFRGERIPTLAEVLDVAGERIRLNIELKFSAGGRDVGPLVRAVIAAVEAKELGPRCVISSLSIPGLAEVRRQAPGFQTGFIVFESVGDPTRLDVDFLSVREALATDDLIAEARRRGKSVHVWSVGDPDRLAALMNRGVANVITDVPGAMVARRAELAELDDLDWMLLWYRETLARR